MTSSGSTSMAVSTIIGTAKETIQFGFLVFLETQKMNLRGNLQDSRCDILHIFMRNFFLPPVDPVVFFETFLPQTLVMFCKTDPFSLTIQPCNAGFLNFSKHRLQEKCFLLSVL